MVTRIRQILEHKQLTPTQFADLIGVGRPVMSHILSERNKPSLEVVKQISSAFPDIALPWLMFGTGEMLVAAGNTVAETPADMPPSTPTVPAEITVPAVPAATLAVPTAVPVSSGPAQAVPRPFTPPAPVASLAAPAQVVAEPVVLPEPALAPEMAPTTAPVVPRPFRAARLAAATSSTMAAATAATPLTTPAANPTPVAAPSSALPMPTATPVQLPPNASSESPMLPFLTEPGKAIRRIVVFYRDGSFTDYQPE